MLGQHRDFYVIVVVNRGIVRVDTGHLVGVSPTPVELIDSTLAHPDERRFLRQAVGFRHELVPQVPRLALSDWVGRHKGECENHASAARLQFEAGGSNSRLAMTMDCR